MPRILAILLTLTASLMADGGLYVHDKQKSLTQSFDGDRLVVNDPMKRVKITHAILRPDTDDKKIIWLELHRNELNDSGDFYDCKSVPERTPERQFHTRSSEFHDHGCKWALRYDDPAEARTSLKKMKVAYDLDERHAIDETAR